ncbi:hypothetical protein [Methylobacterium sp. V23]|uniref:hypothetical protein n=1 Tax=Methylobacterium sp. V23 TaxID=2044878 RepID=UPI0011B033BF|nr:hypothetical protein [Methylobacterium sp. V23]
MDPDEAWLADAEIWQEQMGPMPPRPDWDETNLEVWVRWANWILDHGGQPNAEPENRSDESEYERFQKDFAEQLAEETAWLDEIEQLRRKYPRLAARLHVRESSRARGRPIKGSKSNSKDHSKTAAAHEADINAQLAAQDIKHIRALYRQYFGKRNRPSNLPPHPEELAAARWSADVAMVREKKRRGVSKPRKK